jgi:hypothetical protein
MPLKWSWFSRGGMKWSWNEKCVLFARPPQPPRGGMKWSWVFCGSPKKKSLDFEL